MLSWSRVEAPAVDVHLAGAQLLRDFERALAGAAPHAAGKAVRRIVRDRDRIRFRVVGNDREHRPEDLFLRDRHLVVDVREDRRLDVEALRKIRRPAAAGDERRAFLFALLDESEHRVALTGGRRLRVGRTFIRDGSSVVPAQEFIGRALREAAMCFGPLAIDEYFQLKSIQR